MSDVVLEFVVPSILVWTGWSRCRSLCIHFFPI